MWMDLFFDCIFHDFRFRCFPPSQMRCWSKWWQNLMLESWLPWESRCFANFSQGAKIISNCSWGTWSIMIISFQGERPDESRACDSRLPVRPHPWWHQHHPSYLWKVPVSSFSLVRTLNRDGFSTYREFTAAVEQKQVAQQEAEKARFLVERAEFHKKAAVIQV